MNSVVLTFDDGYRNFLTAAASRLGARNFPATIFLITDRVRDDTNETQTWNAGDDQAYLSWPEVRELMTKFEFGSHTRSHRKLSQIGLHESEQEMRQSQTIIRDRLNIDQFALAYPFGDYSVAVAEKARDLRYTCAVTTDDGTNGVDADLFSLRRTLIGDDDDEAAFAVRVSGLISAISRAKRAN